MQKPHSIVHDNVKGRVQRHLHYERGTRELIIQSGPVDCLDGCWNSRLCLFQTRASLGCSFAFDAMLDNPGMLLDFGKGDTLLWVEDK